MTRSDRSRAKSRSRNGSILPLVAFLMALVMAFLALVTDVMRTVYTGNRLQAAVQAAALGAFSFSTDSDGDYSIATAQANIRDALHSPILNQAPAGPNDESNTFETDVTFDHSDVTFVTNPVDGNDMFLQLRARRDGLDGIKMAFLPAIFAVSKAIGIPVPDSARQANPFRLTEVISQPASRIGAGAPKSARSDSRAGQLSGFATFPLAISNQQFLQASIEAAPSTYTIDLVSAINPPPAVAPNHIRGIFVNVASTGSGSTYYGAAQGSNAVTELTRLLQYFHKQSPPTSIGPGIVERGSLLAGFDVEDPVFKDRQAEVLASLLQVPAGRFQIIPVLRNDPVVGTTNEVVGFARMSFVQYVNQADGKLLLQASFGSSAPLRNASFTNTFKAVPVFTNALMPPPVPPFKARTNSNMTLAALPHGVVMAPSLSPRVIQKIEPVDGE